MVESENSQAEQIKAVVAYLSQVETRGGALDIILSYSSTKQNRDLFRESEICRMLLKYLPESNQYQISQCLVNFSQDNYFIKELIKYNVGTRVFDFLYSNVKMDQQSLEKTSAFYNPDQHVYDVLSVSNKDSKQGSIELLIMLLSNVSVSEEGQKHILGEDKLKGMLVQNLYEMFNYFKENPVYDFIANILSNTAAFIDGRVFIVENKIFYGMIELLLGGKINLHRKQYLSECIRNVCFEYEKFEQEFIDNSVVQKLLQVLLVTDGIEVEDKSGLEWLDFHQDKVVFNERVVKSLMDSLVLLANSEKILVKMHELGVEKVVKVVKTNGNEDIDLQAQVLYNQLITVNNEGDEENEEELEKEDGKKDN